MSVRISRLTISSDISDHICDSGLLHTQSQQQKDDHHGSIMPSGLR